MPAPDNGRYRRVSQRMYADAKFRRLSDPSPCGKALWFHLLTGPHTGIIPGVSVAGECQLAETLHWPVEGFREAFREVFREGLAEADWEARLVWLPNGLKHNPPQSPNVVRSWKDAWIEIPECALKSLIFQSVKAFLEDMGKAFAEAFREAMPEPGTGTGTGTGTGEERGDRARVAPPDATPTPAPAEPRGKPRPPADKHSEGETTAKRPPARYVPLETAVRFVERYPELDTPPIRDALRGWLEVCDGEGKALTAAALTKQLQVCQEWGPARALVALGNSAHRRLPYVAEPFAGRNGNSAESLGERGSMAVARMRGVDVPARLACLADSLPPATPDREAWAGRIRGLSGPVEVVEDALARLDRDLVLELAGSRREELVECTRTQDLRGFRVHADEIHASAGLPLLSLAADG